MVLISTENLERMQHQLRRNPTSFVAGESKEIAVPQNSDNTLSSNNTTQTPGTRLREVVFSIPDGLVTKARGGKCTERHYGDTYGLSEKHEDENVEDNATRCEMPPMITRRRTMTFFTISRKHPIYHRHHIPIVTQILQRKILKF